MLIFEQNVSSRYSQAQAPLQKAEVLIDKKYLRQEAAKLPESSELEVIRHFTKLSQKNFSIDTQMYPLGSCTMKYNPRAAHRLAMLPGMLQRHPLADLSHSQGYLSCIYELQEILKAVTGMAGVSLSPMAGAQGELAGVLMIKAYHHNRGDYNRTEMLVSDSAHGTNPASAVMSGYKVKEIPTGKNGDIDLDVLKTLVGSQTAGIMLTNPSTLGVFEQNITEVAKIVHQAGGLLYYDGANLNAILGRVRPGDMGFDVMHMNLHKTFATPHGGGGPGSGPVAANSRLLPYLPIPMVQKIQKDNNNYYSWLDNKTNPESIGRLSAFMGNAGILIRAYVYAKLLGSNGMHRVSDMATLNANYLMKKLESVGYKLALPDRKATHEFIVTLKSEAKQYSVTARDVAKRLLDYGYHAPSTYFPLLIPECLLIEPTETESKQRMDDFIEVMAKIREEIVNKPEVVRAAPHTMTVKRLDDVKAVKELNIKYF
ncbi:MAG: aminomethyl-transferring glycine dehydrogenase subunit GcvPB [Gammaproteobacteria bacterium]|nr:aminomethyl-transferring glycine dehydrogenase subunit GcvPB [Gammaproteobacteria bacterium]